MQKKLSIVGYNIISIGIGYIFYFEVWTKIHYLLFDGIYDMRRFLFSIGMFIIGGILVLFNSKLSLRDQTKFFYWSVRTTPVLLIRLTGVCIGAMLVVENLLDILRCIRMW